MARVEGRRILRVTWFMGIVVARMEFVGTIVERDGKFRFLFVCSSSHYD